MRTGQRGGILLMTAVGAVFFLGLLALVTDVGWIYFQQSRLETAVEAAWKGGRDRMAELMADAPGPLSEADQTLVIARIRDLVSLNGYAPEEIKDLSITFPDGIRLVVSAQFETPLFFAKILNFSQQTVCANRGQHLLAGNAPDDGGEGIVPLGIPHGRIHQLSPQEFLYHPFDLKAREGFTPGEDYLLSLGNPVEEALATSAPRTETADQGRIRLAGSTGALELGKERFLGAYLAYGYPIPVSINDRKRAHPGSIPGALSEAREIRLRQSRTRIVLPIVDVPDTSALIYQIPGESPTIRIIGFAQFDLLPPSGRTPPTGEDATRTTAPDEPWRGRFVQYLIHPGDIQDQLAH